MGGELLMGAHRVSERAWTLLAAFTREHDAVLSGQNQARNEDGTYTIELDDEFERQMRSAMLPVETVEGFILRRLEKKSCSTAE
jgi:hypothetical protein